MWRRFRITTIPPLTVAATLALAGIGCDSGPTNPDPENVPTIYSPSDSRIELESGPMMQQFSVRDGNGISPTVVNVDLPAGFRVEKAQRGPEEVSLDVSGDIVLGEQYVVKISGSDGDGFPLTPKSYTLFAPAPVDVPSELRQNTTPSTTATGLSTRFSFRVADSNGIDSVVLSVDGVRYEEVVGGSSLSSVSFDHRFGGAGVGVGYLLTVVDGLGNESRFSDVIDVLGRYNVSVSASSFFDKSLVNADTRIAFSHRSLSFDTTLVADVSGVLGARLPEGEYWVGLDGGHTGLDRLRLPLGFADGGSVVARLPSGGEVTYLVSSFRGERGFLSLDRDLVTVMETVFSSQLLYNEMPLQFGETFEVPDPKQLYLHLFFLGNPNCGVDWSGGDPDTRPVETHFCVPSASPAYGAVSTALELANWQEYVSHQRGILNGDVVNGNPYNFEWRTVDVNEVGQYIDRLREPFWNYPVEHVFLYYLKKGTGRLSWDKTYDALPHVVNGLVAVKANRSAWFPAEGRFWWGSKSESEQGTDGFDDCSVGHVRDLWVGNSLICSIVPEGRVQHSWDDKSSAISSAYAPYAMYQRQPGGSEGFVLYLRPQN